ncbi:MAG: DUF1800 domain-containing protein [Kiritimatiellales bacterium]|nr:DUF1800 domain-containing protein [Kiritimatiellales bacterium]
MGSDLLVGTVSNGQFNVFLPGSAASNEFRMLEWSTNMVDWEPVARDYGFDWQNSFPHALPVSTVGANQVLSDPTDATARFFRVLSSATSGLNNSNSVSRFLQQATFGPSFSMITNFPGLDSADLNDAPYTNYEAWIDDQFAKPVSSHRAFWRERSNPNFVDNPANAALYEVGNVYGFQMSYYENGIQILAKNNTNDAINAGRPVNDVNIAPAENRATVWYGIALKGEDALRQKTAWALSQIFVVGEDGSNQPAYTERWLVYYDIFVRNAFGNFRDILGEVTYSPHMGYYLTFDSNKSLAYSGNYPDENYAREVMQLFTIGLWKLNQDGTPMLDPNGNLIPTYSNDDITEFAKVFTGLRRQTGSRPNYEAGPAYTDPVQITYAWHDWDAKTLLDGSTLGPFAQSTANVRADVDGLLDSLFNHPNTPPFIARKLIQRFTVSNPSPQYIHDVAQAFIDNGSGVRGDLGAVLKAILLHPEARESALAYDSAHGRLREPLLRLMAYARAFDIYSLQTYGLFPFYQLEQVFGEAPYTYPSVFNFYLPDYQPTGIILARDLDAPEFQINNDVTSLNLLNAIRTLVESGIQQPIGARFYSQAELDYARPKALAADSGALLDYLDLMITAGRLTPANRATIAGVVDAMPGGSDADREARVKTALRLFALLPEFNVIY